MNDLNLAERIGRLEAIEAIRQLKARYCNACDTQNPERASRCFVPGEVFIDMGHIGVFHTREEFAALYHAAGCHDYVLDHHHLGNAEIEIIDCTRARALWSLGYRNINTQDRTITFLSLLYHDEYTKLQGEWLMASCRVEYKTALHLRYASGTLETLLAARSVVPGAQS